MRGSGLALAAVVFGVALSSCADPTVVDGESPPPDDSARIVCEAEGTRVETPSVRPQRDGVHLVIENRLGFDSGFTVRFGDGGGIGENAPMGESAHILQAPPGAVDVGCYPDAQAIAEPELEPFEVIDADGLYRSAELDCSSVTSEIGDYVEGAPGELGEPIDLARSRFDDVFGLSDDDVVERAGYPESDLPVIRLVRDGKTMATVDLRPADDGGWLEETLSLCDELVPAA